MQLTLLIKRTLNKEVGHDEVVEAVTELLESDDALRREKLEHLEHAALRDSESRSIEI